MTQLCTLKALCIVEGGQGRASQPINGQIVVKLFEVNSTTTQHCLKYLTVLLA